MLRPCHEVITDGGDDGAQGLPLSTPTVFPSSPPLSCMKQPKLHVYSKGYHTIITNNIHVKRLAGVEEM